ncbi:MAG: hypothetical protein IKQ41_07360 [Clostridia bacterium]|nr:hypothetical protein [Clostridia bacterium]
MLKTILVILLVLYGMVTGTAMTDTREPQIIQAESGDEAMQEQLMALSDKMTEAKARSIAAYLKDAGIGDAAEFVLALKETGYTLTFRSGGQQYTAILTKSLLFRQLLDENGKTVYGVIM